MATLHVIETTTTPDPDPLLSVNPIFQHCLVNYHSLCPGVLVQSKVAAKGNTVAVHACLCECHELEDDEAA